MRLRSFLPLLALPLFGCFDGDGKDDTGGGTETAPGEPSITLEPELLDFGELSLGSSSTESFYVGNDGAGTLRVTSIVLSDGTVDFALLNETTELSLAPGEQQEIVVSFTPSASEAVTSSAVVLSDDPDRPEATVTLTGSVPVAELSFEPANYDFGDLFQGCSVEGELALVNGGSAAVEVAALELTGEAFSLGDELALPATLDGGESLPFAVVFLPESEGEHSGSLTAVTGEGEEVQASLLGTGLPGAGTAQDTFSVGEPALDLLFSADQSGSMDDDNRELASLFSDFIANVTDVTTDWQIIVANDDDGCSDVGILTPATPGYAASFENAIVSGGGFYTESLLTVADNAIRAARAGGCNEGFLRDEALLHVVLVSDEPEQSSGAWSKYVAAMQAAKPDWQQLRISAVAGDYPAGCGSADAGTGYYEAVQATGGAFLSICDPWAANVESLAAASVWQWLFELSDTPDPDTIAVRVDGAWRSDDWEYEEGRNAVMFSADFPDADAVVQIEYSVAGLCA